MPSLIDLVRKNQYMSTLDTSRNVKPDKPKGHLVETPLYKVPFEYVEDLARDTKAVIKGCSGKANDYELGRQNDLGMKLGGLAIASYLATKKISQLPKIMEFVGFGSFFASLSLWPKLAIALPLKLRTGVDIQQKYIDSYGRKKNFFLDPQYLPWDLYSKEQIKKIGDKMGVPYDVPNREEVIKEKARKIAVQGNTLWLATAGFATPIMTGLICKGLEPAVEKIKLNYNLKKAEKIIRKPIFLPSDSKEEKAFLEFLTQNIGKKLPVNQNLLSKFGIAKSLLPELEKNLSADLSEILHNVPNEINHNYVNLLYERFGEKLSAAGISKENITKFFKEKGLFGPQTDLLERYRAHCPESKGIFLEDITSELLKEIVHKKKLPDRIEKSLINTVCDISNIKNGVVNPYNIRILDDDTYKLLHNIFKQVNSFIVKDSFIKKWENIHYTQNPDSLCKASWDKGLKAVASIFNFTPKELEAMTLDGSIPEKIVEKKLEEIASDPKKYKNAIMKIGRVLGQMDTVFNEDTRKTFRKLVNDTCAEARNEFEKLGLKHTAIAVDGYPVESIKDTAGNLTKEAIEKLKNGSINRLRQVNYDERVLGQKSILYRFIQALDLKKRLQSDGESRSFFEKQFDLIVKDYEKGTRPNYDEVKDFAKKVIMSALDSEHNTKFGEEQKQTYKTVMRILYGALPEKEAKELIYATVSGEKNELAKAIEKGLEEGYKAAVEAGADKVKLDRIRTGLSKETIEALNEASNKINSRFSFRQNKKINLVDDMKRYFQTFIKKVINAEDTKGFTLTDYNTKGEIEGLAGSMSTSLKKALIGITPAELSKNAATEIYQNKKWVKKFGIAGGIILVGTIIATMFFGDMSKEDMYMKKSEDEKTNKKAVKK